MRLSSVLDDDAVVGGSHISGVNIVYDCMCLLLKVLSVSVYGAV